MKAKKLKQKEVYWSLFQSIAWLMFQTEESVLSMGKKESPSETHLVIWREINRITPYNSQNQAEEKILLALQSGNLIAFGQKNKELPSEEIPAIHWKDLKFGSGRRGANTASLEQFPISPNWNSIAFLSEDIKRLFPSRNERRQKKEGKKKQSPSITQQQSSWTRKYFSELESKKIQCGRDKEFSDFREAFPKASRAMFRKLKKDIAPERCKGGRPSSKNIVISEG